LGFTGRSSVGANMTVFPFPIARLDILNVAGQGIPFATNGTVRIQLPLNSQTNQPVQVQATDFTGSVSVEVVVTPDNGSALHFPATFEMGNTNQIVATVNVIIPTDIPCRVNACTR